MGDFPSDHTMFIGFKALFTKAFNAVDRKLFELVAQEVKSTKKEEKYPWLSGIPDMHEWVGDRVFTRLDDHDFSIKNRKFSNGIAVAVDDIADNELGSYVNAIEELARIAKMFPEKLVFELLRNGHLATALAYDDEPFFSATHPENGLVVSNIQGGTDPGWILVDSSRPIKPVIYQNREPVKFQRHEGKNSDAEFFKDERYYAAKARGNAGYAMWQLSFLSNAALTETNVNDAMATMMERQNDDGRDLDVVPDTIIVPPALRAQAKAIFETDRLTGGGSNPNYKELRVVVTNKIRGAGGY